MSDTTYKLTDFVIFKVFTLELVVVSSIRTTELCLAEAMAMSVRYLYYRIQFTGVRV